MEDNSSVPSLQDILLGDFDLTGLEELAESLLSNVTTELEEGFGGSSHTNATLKSPAVSVSERLVGTTTKKLESSQNINRSLKTITTPKETKAQTTTKHLKLSDQKPSTTTTFVSVIDVDDMIVEDDGTDDSFYGTYDEKTNSITVVLSDDSIPVADTIEEIVCEDEVSIEEAFHKVDDEVNMITSECNLLEEQHKELEVLTPLPKSEKSIFINSSRMPSPLHSIFSDSDYDSLGSPNDHDIDDLWNNTSFLELFPSAV